MDARDRLALVVLAVLASAVWIAVWLVQADDVHEPRPEPGRTAPAVPAPGPYVNHLTYNVTGDVPAPRPSGGEPAWTHTCLGLATDTGCP